MNAVLCCLFGEIILIKTLTDKVHKMSFAFQGTTLKTSELKGNNLFYFCRSLLSSDHRLEETNLGSREWIESSDEKRKRTDTYRRY